MPDGYKTLVATRAGRACLAPSLAGAIYNTRVDGVGHRTGNPVVSKSIANPDGPGFTGGGQICQSFPIPFTVDKVDEVCGVSDQIDDALFIV